MNCEIKDCDQAATQVIQETVPEEQTVLPLETGGAKVNFPEIRNVCDLHAQELIKDFPDIVLWQPESNEQ